MLNINTVSPEDIIGFWYADAMKPYWFSSTPEIDKDIQSRFERVWEKAIDDGYEQWSWTAEGCLALAIIFDQFPLNMFRGDAKAFSSESKGIDIAKHAIEKGFDKVIDKDRISFLYMPLMHSEQMADQDLAVIKFDEAGLEHNAQFARHHRGIVERFGRFPHRNALLGRESTQAELDYLNSDEAFTG